MTRARTKTAERSINIAGALTVAPLAALLLVIPFLEIADLQLATIVTVLVGITLTTLGGLHLGRVLTADNAARNATTEQAADTPATI